MPTQLNKTFIQNQNLKQSPLIHQMALDEIRYSMVWEDPDLLSEALLVHSADHVLSIGSAGCNALHLLLSNPLSVTAIDLSPAQTALIALKKLAIERLTHKDFLSLLGYGNNNKAESLYLRLRPDMSEQDQFFFDQRTYLFERGLSSQGRLEKYFETFRVQILNQLWDGTFIKALLKCQEIEEQISLLKDHGQIDLLKLQVEKYFGISGLTQGRSEAQMKYVTRTDVGTKLFNQFFQVLNRDLISENHFLHLFLTGKLVQEKHRPAVLQEANYSRLQNQIDKLEIVNSDIESFLATTDRQFSKMNLSDIFEYLSPNQTIDLLGALAAKMPMGGRLAYWTLLVDREPPSFLQPLENQDLPNDRLWFYDRFHVVEKSWLA